MISLIFRPHSREEASPGGSLRSIRDPLTPSSLITPGTNAIKPDSEWEFPWENDSGRAPVLLELPKKWAG